jgi:hypothetical protein
MNISLKLHEVALKSIEVFSAEAAVKMARDALSRGYDKYRMDFMDWEPESYEERPRIQEGSEHWDAMMLETKPLYTELQSAKRELRNAKRRLDTAIRSAIGG